MSEQQVRFSPAQISKTLQGYKKNVMVAFSVPPWELRREEKAGLAASHKQQLWTTACGTEWKIWGAEPGAVARGGCFSQGKAPLQPRQHALPQEKGRITWAGASLFWPLLPGMEERVLRFNTQMCNTSCEKRWVAGTQPKFVVLCEMEPGQSLLASQKQPELHKNTPRLSSTQEITFLPMSYTTMAFDFPCMPCLGPF